MALNPTGQIADGPFDVAQGISTPETINVVKAFVFAFRWFSVYKDVLKSSPVLQSAREIPFRLSESQPLARVNTALEIFRCCLPILAPLHKSPICTFDPLVSRVLSLRKGIAPCIHTPAFCPRCKALPSQVYNRHNSTCAESHNTSYRAAAVQPIDATVYSH